MARAFVGVVCPAHRMLRALLFQNIAAREKENQKWLAASAKPKRWWNMLDTMYVNRKTTKYFRCKGCGQILSIPRGKGTMRIVCPKCKTEIMKKS